MKCLLGTTSRWGVRLTRHRRSCASFVQAVQTAQRGLENVSFLAIPDSFRPGLRTFCRQVMDIFVAQVQDHRWTEKIWKLLHETLFDGKDAHVVNELFQRHL